MKPSSRPLARGGAARGRGDLKGCISRIAQRGRMLILKR